MRITRAAVGITITLTIAVGLSGCGILPSPIDLLTGEGAGVGGGDPGPTTPPSAEVEVGSCLGDLDYGGDVTPRDELTSCSLQHGVDVIAMPEWPGMAALLSTETTKTVWDEVSNSYALKGLAVEYQDWAATACGDAWRASIGWDRLSVAGITASDLKLLPAAPFDVVAAVAEFGDFRDGDHRTRCVLDWYDPIAYRDLTPADLLSDQFPIVARDCYSVDGANYLQPRGCTVPHTDQALLTFDGLAGLGPEFVQPGAVLDEDQALRVNNFCMAAVQATFGTLEARDHYIWGGPWGSYDWDALVGEPDPDGSYPFGCVVARYDGGTERGDILASR